LPFLAKQQDVTLSYFSRTAEKAEACAREFGGRVAGSLMELLADDPDAVLVLTRETDRYAVTNALLDAGRPRRLFFEKPLVAMHGQANVQEEDFTQAAALLQRAEAAGVETAMVFNYRFFEQTQRARQIVEERGFGPLRQASLLVNYACWSHCIDLLSLFGGRAAVISALAGETEYEGAVDVSAAFTLANGATGSIVGTSGTDFSLALYDMTLCFAQGMLRFRDLDGTLEVYQNGSRYAETYALIGNHSRWDQYNDSFAKALAAYLDTVRADAPPPVAGLAGLLELQFEAALRRSIAEGRPVDVQRGFALAPAEV
jgi:predicted dehydrogenase